MADTLDVSVILPTRNPDAGRFRRALAGLAEQTLDPARWELLLVDNASQPPVSADAALTARIPNFRTLSESKPGLTAARLCGIHGERSIVSLC